MFYKLIAKIVSHPKVFNYLLNKAVRTPYTHIYDASGEEIYMERYWLFNPYFAVKGLMQFKWLPISIRIHKINVHDHDQHMHDHPWNARSFIMKGYYTEERLSKGWAADFWNDTELVTRKSGDTARLNFGEYHRITEVSKGGVYTIFVTGRKQGTWGFLVKGIKVKYWEYLGLSHGKDRS